MTQAGELRHRVQVMTMTDARDELGGRTNAPALVATLWAKVAPTGGSSSFKQGRMESTCTHLVTFRATDLVKAGHVIRLGNSLEATRWLRVDSTERRQERGWWLECSCTEVPTWPG